MCNIDVSKIYGKIKIVQRFPDYKVQVVKGDADLRVKLVENPDASGKWKIVDDCFDIRIKLVDNAPDFTIKCAHLFDKSKKHKTDIH